MSKIPNVNSLRSVSELKYVNADNVSRYRAIMRFLYEQYQKLNYWLKPEQIFKGIMSWNLHEGYTLEQCQIDLEQLIEWGNLSSRHDGGRAVTVEEYLRKKYQYLLTPYSIEIERLLEGLERVHGYGGSLEPTLLDRIADILIDIHYHAGAYKLGEALELWKSLYDAFQRLHKTSVDYIASLQTNRAEELMATDAFLVYKDSLTQYLRDFVQALQRRSFKIEGNFAKIKFDILNLFFEAVIEDEWQIPKLEETFTKQQYAEELLEKWHSVQRWFIGESGSTSELVLLENASKEAVVRMMRSATRIQERRRSTISRKKELEYLGEWFYRSPNLDSAHKLAAYAFGLFPTRHLQGPDNRESDSSEISMWEEPSNTKTLRSKSRKKNERLDTDSIIDKSAQKKILKQEYILKHRQELQFVIQMVEKENLFISEFGIISELERIQILRWISLCTAASQFTFYMPEGIRVRLKQPLNQERTILQCEDGELELLNYELQFQVANKEAWIEMKHWIETII
ncbi:TIGR02677 family protein [Paenibacillus sp. PK4536]|uniref:TIGR02677 family protein n=1 Tax=Paenibacillus sp. PK4536 TaxID=3024576 RepID=UPI0023595653|nr:TIGR02677 family protein [Paenibacillus sp. PK4536]WIM40343.1 TIGR02677 family protein [Paenibacillus sp. PK4536]